MHESTYFQNFNKVMLISFSLFVLISPFFFQEILPSLFCLTVVVLMNCEPELSYIPA